MSSSKTDDVYFHPVYHLIPVLREDAQSSLEAGNERGSPNCMVPLKSNRDMGERERSMSAGHFMVNDLILLNAFWVYFCPPAAPGSQLFEGVFLPWKHL